MEEVGQGQNEEKQSNKIQEENGFNQASEVNGKPALLKDRLRQIVNNLAKKFNNDEEAKTLKQNQYKKEIQSLEKNKAELAEKIKEKDKDIQENEKSFIEQKEKRERKIKDLEENLDEKRKSLFLKPEDNLAKNLNLSPRPNFAIYIAYPVLGFLTVFLWIFYSSALHSALIRDIQDDLLSYYQNIEISESDDEYSNIDSQANTITSIINLNAIEDAWEKGKYIGVILLLVAFSIPTGAGLILYIFRDSIWKVILVYFVTLVFDIVLAFHIVRDIYIAKHEIGVTGYEEAWLFDFFYSQVSFYMILFIGFLSYLMWGIILNYILGEYDKKHPAAIAYDGWKNDLDELEQMIETKKNENEKIEKLKLEKIEVLVAERSSFSTDLKNLGRDIADIEKKIDRDKEKRYISKPHLEQEIDSFCSGWCKWIEQEHDSRENKRNIILAECLKIKEEVLKETFNSGDYFTIKNL